MLRFHDVGILGICPNLFFCELREAVAQSRRCYTSDAIRPVALGNLTWWNEVWVVLEKESDIQRVDSVLPNEHGKNLRTTRKCHSRQNIHTATYWMGRIDMLCWYSVVWYYVVWYSVASRNSSSWTHVHRTPRCPPPPPPIKTRIGNVFYQALILAKPGAWCQEFSLYKLSSFFNNPSPGALRRHHKWSDTLLYNAVLLR